MALVWQLYRLLINLPNFSSCFSKFIKSFIYISGIQRGRNRPPWGDFVIYPEVKVSRNGPERRSGEIIVACTCTAFRLEFQVR